MNSKTKDMFDVLSTLKSVGSLKYSSASPKTFKSEFDNFYRYLIEEDFISMSEDKITDEYYIRNITITSKGLEYYNNLKDFIRL